MKPEWQDLTDLEQEAIREYYSWAHSEAPFEYKIAMVEQHMANLQRMGIAHIVTNRTK